MLYKNLSKILKPSRKLYLLYFIFLFLLTIINSSGLVKALDLNSQLTWKTANVIIVNGTNYVYETTTVVYNNNDLGDTARIYSDGGNCTDRLFIYPNEPTSVYLLKATPIPGSDTYGEKCNYSFVNSNLFQSVLRNEKDPSNKYIIHFWQDKNTIVRLSRGFDGTEIGSVTYKRKGKSKLFIEQTGSECKDSMTIQDPYNAQYTASSEKSGEKQVIGWDSNGEKQDPETKAPKGSCFESTPPVGIKLGYGENANKDPKDATPVPGEGDTGHDGPGDDASQESNCSQALSPFGWVLCPATNFADNLYSLFKQLVNDILFFESDKYQNNGLYNSWKIMVTLANTILVLVAIVMIAAQIFNFEFISAYTVKKALPRIVIAAILIQLSWFMVTTGIQIVNAIGSGLYWLLVAPFASKLDLGDSGGVLEIGPILAQNYSGTDVGNGAGNAAVFYFAMMGLGAAAVGAAVSGLWLTVIIAAIGVVISLLVAIVTLVIREVLLIVLIAIAPLAIAMWILPGTTGLWSLWWKTFSRLLMMYPLIMLLFAGGTIAAILLASTGSGINILFAIIAFFAPMFMIGATYKFAGGAFASMANFINKSGGAIGGKIKSGNLGGLKKVAENQKASREYNRQEQGIRNIERGGFRGRIGRLQAGTAGAHGSYSSILRAQEEKKAYENASFAYGQATKGMDFPDQVDDSLTIASARSGETITLSNGQQLTVSESTQKVAAKFLADTGRSDQIRQLEHNLRQDNRVELWNTIAAENASAITKMNPDQMGKAFDTLSAAEISDVKPGTMRNIRAMMADGNVDQRRKDRVMAQVNELYNNETLRSKLGAESLGHVEEMITSPNLTRETSVIIDGQNQRHVENIDRFGQTQHIIDNNGNRVANPNFTQDNGW